MEILQSYKKLRFCTSEKSDFRRSERRNLSIFRKNIKVPVYLFVKVSTEYNEIFY